MKYNILPTPKLVLEEGGAAFATANCPISFACDCDKRVIRAAAELKGLLEVTDSTFHKLSGDTENCGGITISLNDALEPQGYNIFISENGILLEGGDAAGQFYAIVTLKQLVEAYKTELPAIVIKDSPDMQHRGHYYDATRGRVPSVEGVKRMVDTLVKFKINSLQLYIEHTFDFEQFANDGRTYEDFLTAEDILEIDAYCRDRFVEFIPSLSTFGHLYELLQKEEYRHLCELNDFVPEGHFWRERMSHHTINPSDPESLEMICSLIDQYLPLFSSEYFNICCDETFDLCRGKNEGKDRGKLYCEFVNKIIAHIASKGKKIMMWGDIALEHPEALELLPKDTVFLNWDYWREPNISRIECIKENNFNQIVCPGVSSWSRLIENPEIAVPNIVKMARGGYDNGALGLLNTNWGDHGHPCHFECSLYGVALGGCVSWNIDTVTDEDYDTAISRVAYGVQKNIVPLIKVIAASIDTYDWINLINWNESRDKSIFKYEGSVLQDRVDSCSKAMAELAEIDSEDNVLDFLLNAAEGNIVLNEAIGIIINGGDTAAWKQRVEEWLCNYEALWLMWDKRSELYEIRAFIENIL